MRTSTLSKDQVQKLPPDQQDAFARMLVEDTQSRLQLLQRARRYWGMSVFGGLLTGLGSGLAILSAIIPRALPFAIIVVSGAVAFHAAGANQRLDALMELLEADIRRATQTEKSDDDKVT
jgi:hypothetical protein